MRTMMRRFFAGAIVASSAFVLVSTTASVATMPVVDLNVGPIAVNAQAVNIALALSVEWPTVGSAYRDSTYQYDHTKTYLGYWDHLGCYEYRDPAVGAPMEGRYFYRSGNVDGNRYCNTGGAGVGTGYSGNVLNYVATSSIDLLRYALTGGNRVVDGRYTVTNVVSGSPQTTTADYTVLERAYLRNSWGLNNGEFRSRYVAADLEGKVTPDFPGTGNVWGGSCKDRIVFGRDIAGTNCDSPGTSDNLNPTELDPTATRTVVVSVGSPAPTPPAGGTVQFVTTTWSITSNTTTAVPSAGPIQTFTYTTLGTGTSTTVPPGYSPTVALAYTQYTLNGTTSTIAPTGTEPTVVYGTSAVPLSPRLFRPTAPTLPYRTLTLASNVFVCGTSAGTNQPYRGSLDSSGAPQNVGNSACGNTPFSGFSTRERASRFTNNSANLPVPAPTVYEPQQVQTVYRRHTATPIYWTAITHTAYWVYALDKDEYLETGSKTAVMYARVRVCNGSEATSRPDLCLRYPDGNYKPAGEIQRNAEGARVAAFGYVGQDGVGRNGGVLRAPMRFTGPRYRDPNGAIQTNAQPEWDINTGVFKSDPLGVSPTFATSGVINYLNKFGTTGVLGYYKENDPVGELYYEVLRYFQGLAPSSNALSGLSDAHYENFPVYGATAASPKTLAGWVDPIQNSCQRKNFILTIGDVNTHADRGLPGHGSGASSGLVNANDPARAAEPLLGDGTKSFNAVDWTALVTGFETGVSRSYVDALGRTQNTLGNPNTNGSNTNLEGKNGGCCNGAYYWAGAAYWANTQPIRWDTKAGSSMKDVRVRTFTIDVDEGGDGSIENGNPRAIKPRNSSFYLAGKYGWFQDANLDGNPFKTSGGVTNNKEWEDPDAPNTPDGYVIASQAQKLMNGIRKFFAAATSEKGAVSVSSLSSQRFTTQEPNGDLFAPRFNTIDWSGTVQRSGLILNTATDTIETVAGVKWDSGSILTAASVSTTPTLADPYVKPADRKIFTMARGAGTTSGQEFSVANRGNLDAVVQAALNTNPATTTTDNLADARINWLRGVRTDEQNSGGGLFRRRNSIMGDVINSGPVFKQGADPEVRGPGYGTFASTVAGRVPMIYVGANDGMLHAFRATDGKEMFAYIPRAVSEHLNKLTNPAYVHRPYVDGVPNVGEAQVGTDWKTVLVGGMGGGAQGVYALDVTSPTSFGASNVMFEFTDEDDPDMGNILMQPKLVKMRMAGGTPSYKWFIAVGSGYNNYKNDGTGRYSTSGKQALFLLSLDKQPNQAWAEGTNYFKMKLSDPDTSVATGLTNPGFTTGAAGEAIYFYSGDLQGNVWKFDFSSGLNSTQAASAVKTISSTPAPMFVATDSGGSVRQPITTSPLVTSALKAGYMVVFGTGKFLEPSDADNANMQSVYGVWDSQTSANSDFAIGRSKLYQRTMTAGTSTVALSGSPTFAYGDGTGSGADRTYRGWFVDLTLSTKERVATEGVAGLGFVAFNSTIPEGGCSGDGTGRSMCFTSVFGLASCDFQQTQAGLLSRPNVVTIISDDVADAYTTRTSTGRRMSIVKSGLISTGTKITEAGNVASSTSKVATPPLPGGRMGWREIRNFKDN